MQIRTDPSIVPGHQISKGCRSPSEAKAQCVTDCPTPKYKISHTSLPVENYRTLTDAVKVWKGEINNLDRTVRMSVQRNKRVV